MPISNSSYLLLMIYVERLHVVYVNTMLEHTLYSFSPTDGWIKGKMMVKLSENYMLGTTVSSMHVSVMHRVL